MKKYLILGLIFCGTISAFAQKNYVDNVADSACKCMEAIKNKIKNASDFDKQAEACILNAALPYMDTFAKEENIPVEELNEDMGSILGKKIGMKLVANCPLFIELAQAYSAGDEKDIVTGTATGVVTAVQISDHVYLTIKEASGKITKVVWMYYFTGADDYKANPARVKGRKVEVDWEEADIYFIVKKDFSTVKAISKLTVL